MVSMDPTLGKTDLIDALFFIPVGPNDCERILYAVESIRANCVDYRIYLLLDGPPPSSLPRQIFGPDVCIHVQEPPTKANGGGIWLMYCRAMYETLDDASVSSRAVFIKMDADALVIRPGVAQRAQAIFESRKNAGQLGQCFTNITGASMPNNGWANFMKKIRGWRGMRRCILGAIKAGEGWYVGLAAFFKCRSLMRKANEFGYRLGEYALGGCFILRRELVAALGNQGLLSPSPFRFLIYKEGTTAGCEDVIMTPYVYAAGYSVMDDVSDGGIFGIEGQEFRLDPFKLKERGHYIIHPMKYGYKSPLGTFSEYQLVSALLPSKADLDPAGIPPRNTPRGADR